MGSFVEESLYELEKKLIEKHPKLRGIKPRPIVIIDTDKHVIMVALSDKIEISRGFLEGNPSQTVVEKNLTHDLLHYVHPGQGHSIEFLKDAEEMGILDDYDRRQLTNELNQTRLEGRIFYKTNEEGEQEFMVRDEPSWEGFEEVFVDTGMAVGELLRSLREGYQISRSEAAESIGISEEELKRVEENRDYRSFYMEEDLLKNIFMGIINASGKWKNT